MKRFELLSVEIEGFRSFAASTFIDFTRDGDFPRPGFKFLTGRNDVEPRLGANGAGKSSIWDALIWCLFGRTARGARASEVTHWQHKRCVVCVTFAIDDEVIQIERHGNPERITRTLFDNSTDADAVLTTEPFTQADVDRLLGISRARFMQSIVFGQSVPLFLDLDVPSRGALFDEILDLGIWPAASERARKAVIQHENTINELLRQRSKLEGGMEQLEDVAALEAASARHVAEYKERVAQAINAVEEAEANEAAATTHHAETEAALVACADPAEDERIIAEARGAATAFAMDAQEQDTLAKAADARISFFEANDVCPSCEQTISGDHRVRHEVPLRMALQKHSRERDRLRRARDEEEQTVQTVSATKRAHELARNTAREAHVIASNNLRHARSRSQQAASAAERLIDNPEPNPHAAAIKARSGRLATLQAEIKELDASIGNATLARDNAAHWQAGFRRVRYFAIQRALALLTIETANAASALGLPGWRITYATERETRTGTLKSGIHIEVFSPVAEGAWTQWSGGEGQRIKLAINIGLSMMIQRLAGVAFQFEVWDEPTAGLSPEGISDLLECLRARAHDARKTVWLVDQHALGAGAFDEVWLACKTETGTTVEQITHAKGE